MSHQSIKYIMYLRKSTDDKSRQVRSIADQRSELQEFAQRNNLVVIDVLLEKQSAKRPGRPVFNEMLRRIEVGEAHGILSWHPDRLARNSRDGGHIMDLLDIGVLHDLKFPTFTYENSASGKLMLAMMFSQSKYYVDNLSENIRRGKRRKAAEGVWPGPAPLGYSNHPQRRCLVPDPKVTPHVTRAFERFSTGNYTLEQIASLLRKAGVKGTHGKVISPSTAQRMLQNPIYYGSFRFKGELMEGTHEPLISKRLFDRCQSVMSKRSRPKSKGLKPFLYRGLIRCSVCGGMVTSETSKGHVYLHCSKRKEPCKHEYRPAVREEAISQQINEALFRLSLPDDWVEGMLEMLTDEQSRLAEAAERKRVELDEERQRLQDKLSRAEEGWLDGVISKSRYREIKSELVAQRQSLDEEIAELERSDLNRLEPMARFLKASKRAKKLASEGTPVEQLDFFKKVGSNPQLVTRQLLFTPRGPWQHVEKSRLLVSAPADAHSSAGRKSRNSLRFSTSGEGGIRTHGEHEVHTGFRDRPVQPLRHLSCSDRGTIINLVAPRVKTKRQGGRGGATVR